MFIKDKVLELNEEASKAHLHIQFKVPAWAELGPAGDKFSHCNSLFCFKESRSRCTFLTLTLEMNCNQHSDVNFQ